MNIELADWVNDFPADINDETETTSRTVGGTCTADFPQIQIPDMPLDDCYVAQYISNAETNMKKKTDEDLVEIREKVEYLCDVCILVYEGRSVSKSVAEKKKLYAVYHNPVEKMNLCSDCYNGNFSSRKR